VLAFAMQTVSAIWVMDTVPYWTPHATYATALTLGVVFFDVFYFMGIHTRFFGRHNEWGKNYNVYQAGALPEQDVAPHLPSSHLNQDTGQGSTNVGSLNAPLLAHSTTPSDGGGGGAAASARRQSCMAPAAASSAAGSGQARRGSMLNNPLARIEVNPDAMQLNQPARAMSGVDHSAVGAAPASELNHTGLLSKRSAPVESSSSRVGGRAALLGRRLATSVTGEWRDRFFVLRDGKLNYWASEADYDADKPAALEIPIDLRGHEILVDTDSPKWAFTIAPCHDERNLRTWYLRAPTEEARLVWARKLVLNTLMHSEN